MFANLFTHRPNAFMFNNGQRAFINRYKVLKYKMFGFKMKKKKETQQV